CRRRVCHRGVVDGSSRRRTPAAGGHGLLARAGASMTPSTEGWGAKKTRALNRLCYNRMSSSNGTAMRTNPGATLVVGIIFAIASVGAGAQQEMVLVETLRPAVAPTTGFWGSFVALDAE